MCPRDGLQNEPDFIATENKIKLVDMCRRGCKVSRSPVSCIPMVPQLADSLEVLKE